MYDESERPEMSIRKVKGLLSEGSLEEALAFARALVERAGQDPVAWLCLGLAQRKGRRFLDAVRSFDMALELDQGTRAIDALVYRALCKVSTDDIEGAYEDARRAVKLDAGNVRAMALRSRLKTRLGMMASVRDVVRRKGGGGTGAPVAPVGPGTVSVPVSKAQGPVRRKGPARYISTRLTQEIVDSIEEDRDSILVVAPTVFTFRAATAALQTLIEMYEMDGVMVCVDRPPRFMRKALARYTDRLELVHFIGMEGSAGTARMTGTGGGDGKGPDATCQFHDLEELLVQIEEGLQGKAQEHGGEDHFVMFDEVSVLRHFHNQEPLRRFFEELGGRLEEMGMVHVAVIAKEKAELFPRWFGSRFRLRLTVKGPWFGTG